MMDKALQLSKTQAQMAVELGRAMSAGVGALFLATTAFATANTENQTKFVTALLAAKTPEAVAELQREFLNHSLHTASAAATQIAAAFAATAKPFEAVAEADAAKGGS